MASGIRLYVGNLPPDVTKVHLRDIFTRMGQVLDVYIPLRREEGRVTREALGYAFVEMGTEWEAQEAIRVMHDMHGPDGRKMCVRIAAQRAQLAS